MTEKLFYKDSYIKSAECEIEQIFSTNGKLEIVLKSTPFYPEGGGQPCDVGTIGGLLIEYVYENEDGTVYHVMKDHPETIQLEKGKTYSCEVDFARKFDLIQQHSGEHVLSGAFFKLFHAVNAGFHLGEDYVTIDMECKNLTTVMIREAEKEANAVIYANKPVNTSSVSKEASKQFPFRKEVKAEGEIRIVEIADGADCCACCGTHVKFTGEIGLIKILKHENYKGLTRIYFKCGNRAFEDYASKHNSIMELTRLFSAEASEVVAKVNTQLDTISEMKLKLAKLYTKIAEAEAQQLLLESKNGMIEAEYEDEEFEFLERVYEELKEKASRIVLYSMKDKRLIFANAGVDGSGPDCGKIFKEMLKQYNGRGGGNSKRAQASFDTVDAMREFADYLMMINK